MGVKTIVLTAEERMSMARELRALYRACDRSENQLLKWMGYNQGGDNLRIKTIPAIGVMKDTIEKAVSKLFSADNFDYSEQFIKNFRNLDGISDSEFESAEILVNAPYIEWGTEEATDFIINLRQIPIMCWKMLVSMLEAFDIDTSACHCEFSNFVDSKVFDCRDVIFDKFGIDTCSEDFEELSLSFVDDSISDTEFIKMINNFI